MQVGLLKVQELAFGEAIEKGNALDVDWWYRTDGFQFVQTLTGFLDVGLHVALVGDLGELIEEPALFNV